MFCENCGSKAIEGNRFCTACGQARRSIPASDSFVSPSPELPKTPAEECVRPDTVSSASSADQILSAAGPAPLPSEKALYCKHSPSERTKLGEAIRPGSDICYGCKLPYAPGSPNSGSRPVAEATTRAGVMGSVDALGNGLDGNLTPQGGAGRRARWPLGLIAALTALVVLGVMGVALNTTASGAPPADPAQALHRLKDVAKIDLPIDDAAVDTGRSLVPADMPQEPSAVGKYVGAVSMASGDTVELRVSAYTLAADAAQYTVWWNTSGVKEYFAESSAVSVAVQCGRIVIDGAWVDRHSHDETIKLLHDAYPDCTPYLPEKVSAPGPSTEPSPTVEALPASPVEETPAPEPTLTRTQPPRVDGRDPNGVPGAVVAGAFVITNLVVSNKNPNDTTVSFTVKNTTKLKLLLIPAVVVSDGNRGTPGTSTMWGGDQGIGTPCYLFSPYESDRITIGQGYNYGDGGFPTNWTSAVVTNIANHCP
jgi:hypothetical protein